jgi:TatD DNase family protein
MFIDTHCHLDATEFDDTQATLVQDAQAVGVNTIIVPSVARINFNAVRKLCAQHSNCLPAYGIHPIYTDNVVPNDLVVLRNYLEKHDSVAVGEIGLDFFIKNYDQSRQEHFFIEQLKLAREFNSPVLLHIRRAQDTILKYLRQHKVRGGIAHAFNGSRQQADEFIKLGFKLGFGGVMTYPRATRLRELAKTLPLDSIVLETDAPDMAPIFVERGQPNKPEYLARIAETIAELRDMPVEEVAHITTENVLSVLPYLKTTTHRYAASRTRQRP